MFLLAKFLDTMAQPLAETDRDAWIAIDDGLELLARDLQQHRIIQGPDICPMRFAAEQRHFAKAITVAIRGKNAFPPALEPRVRLQTTRNNNIQRVAWVIFAHHEVALLDRDKLRLFRQAFHQLFAETGQNRHAFKYLELVLHVVILIADPLIPSGRPVPLPSPSK